MAEGGWDLAGSVQTIPGRSGRRRPGSVRLAVLVGTGAIGLSVLLGSLLARFTGRHTFPIPGAPGYVMEAGSHGKPFVVGRPWGVPCQPVALDPDSSVPGPLTARLRSMAARLFSEGFNVEVTTPDGSVDPNSFRPAVVMPVFVTIEANSSATPTLGPSGPEHVQFAWASTLTADRRHEMLDRIDATLYLRNIGSGAPARDLVIRQLLAFAEGLGASDASGSGIAIGSTTGHFSAADLRAMRIVSGCHPT